MKKKKVIAQQVLSAVLAIALVSSSSSVSKSLHLNIKAAENTMERENGNSELQSEETLEETKILHNGQEGALNWSIDENGLLVISGKGDYDPKNNYNYEPEWCKYASNIKSAKVNVTDIRYTNNMFYGCSNLTSLDFSNFNTSNVMYMYRMFQGCSSLTSLDLSNFDTHNARYMTRMFYGCSSLKNLDVSNFTTSIIHAN